MKCVVCGSEAEFVLSGSSYCQNHFNGMKSNKTYSGKMLYLTGMGVWVAGWFFLVLVDRAWTLNLFGGPKYWPLFLLPFTFGIVSLGVNAYLSRNQSLSSTYETEQKMIESVERNSSWFLLGSSGIFAWATLARQSLGITSSAVPFIIYISASLIFLSPVILLFWIPHPEPRNLGRLRHWKTIPFTYAVSFFTAAVLTLLVGVLSA